MNGALHPDPVHGEAEAPALGSILDALDAGAVVFDADGTLRYASGLAAQCVGLSPAELTGKTREAWRVLLSQAFTGQGEEGALLSEGNGELVERLETRGFLRRTFERRSRPVIGADGQPAGRVEVLRNITEQVRSEEERQRHEARHAREMAALEASLREAEDFKMDLTANVTHDLRTPLASIKASVSGLLAGDVSYNHAELRETLSVIEEETDRMQRRVQNLLAAARMERGEVILHRDWIDLPDVLQSALECLKGVKGFRPVILSYPEELPLLYADYDQLQIAIRNLVENAFLYSPPDDPVEITVSMGLGSVHIRVVDRGQGLMPDEFEKVFEKFYRGRSARRIPGTGLGLPICRTIAEAHGGGLWVEHVPEGGVAFVLSIPLQEGTMELDDEDTGLAETQIDTDGEG